MLINVLSNPPSNDEIYAVKRKTMKRQLSCLALIAASTPLTLFLLTIVSNSLFLVVSLMVATTLLDIVCVKTFLKHQRIARKLTCLSKEPKALAAFNAISSSAIFPEITVYTAKLAAIGRHPIKAELDLFDRWVNDKEFREWVLAFRACFEKPREVKNDILA